MSIRTAAILLAAAAVAGSAAAQPAKDHDKQSRQCFLSRDWSSWKAPDDKTIYLRVGVSDIYRLDLANACPDLRYPNSHIINQVRGSDYICGPLDLDLKVSADRGFAVPCIVKSMRKLSKVEATAIPKKDRP